MRKHDQAKTQQETFDPVAFIHDGKSEPLSDSRLFPYLYNAGGLGKQLVKPAGNPIEIEPVDPDLERGARYRNITQTQKTIEPESGPPYTITLFDFGVKEVRYEPLIASRDNARAFGMTLLRDGDCVAFPYDNLVMSEYDYGKWAAYQSPYLGKGRGRELLTINPTDLEYHDFPHVFFSRDSLALVISVARWRPYAGEIALADLWLPPSSALILPPRIMPDPPPPGTSSEDARKIVLDLHGNRNSALACRFVDGRPVLRTTTILGNSAVMVDPKTKPRYHEEQTATLHPLLQP